MEKPGFLEGYRLPALELGAQLRGSRPVDPAGPGSGLVDAAQGQRSLKGEKRTTRQLSSRLGGDDPISRPDGTFIVQDMEDVFSSFTSPSLHVLIRGIDKEVCEAASAAPFAWYFFSMNHRTPQENPRCMLGLDPGGLKMTKARKDLSLVAALKFLSESGTRTYTGPP